MKFLLLVLVATEGLFIVYIFSTLSTYRVGSVCVSFGSLPINLRPAQGAHLLVISIVIISSGIECLMQMSMAAI